MKCFSVCFIIFLFWTWYARAQEGQFPIADTLIQLPNVDSLVQAPHLDSLNLNPVDSLNRKINAVETNLNALKDSLNEKGQLPDSLLGNPLSPLMQKVDSVKLKAEALADSVQNKMQLPDSLKGLLPEDAALLENEYLPELETKELDKLKALEDHKALEKIKSIEDINMKEISNPAEIESLKTAENLKALEKLPEKTAELKEISSKAENLSETAESEVKKTNAFQELEAQKGELGKQKEAFEKFGHEDYYKEKAISTVKEKAKDHFAGHRDKLQAAQEKLAKIKKKYPEGVSSLKDLPKIRPNAMKGKSLKERLLVGLTVQIHKDQTPNVDLSPFTAFKLTGRLSFGLGGNYRLMTQDDFKGFTRKGAVYGYRAFGELKIYKGFFVHAGYELMKTPKADSVLYKAQPERKEKVWVDGLMVGIGKDYKIARYVNGNMQVLYNLLDEVNSPYRSKVMVRFGFSFQLNKKIKKPKLPEIDEKKMLEKSKGKAKNKARKLLDVEQLQ